MLKLESVSKSFGEKTLFRDFSFSFNHPGIYALKGKSGVGKTTMLRIICGLETEYSGTVLGGGMENTAICFQEHRLFPWLNAKENVLKVSFKSPNEENEKQTELLLKRLFLTDNDMTLLPSELSGGMRQRVSFARAVLRKSPILLLDEATKEVDAEVANVMMEIIKEESKNRIVIIITHKDEEISALNAEIISLD